MRMDRHSLVVASAIVLCAAVVVETVGASTTTRAATAVSGSRLRLLVQDFEAAGVETELFLLIDSKGEIELGETGIRVKIVGMTAREIEDATRKALKEAGIIEAAQVSVEIGVAPSTKPGQQ